jgi:hypothetical protein
MISTLLPITFIFIRKERKERKEEGRNVTEVQNLIDK